MTGAFGAGCTLVAGAVVVSAMYAGASHINDTVELIRVTDVIDSSPATAVFTSVADCALTGFERADCKDTKDFARDLNKGYTVPPTFNNFDDCDLDFACKYVGRSNYQPIMEAWQVGVDAEGNMTAEALPVYLEADTFFVRPIGDDKVEAISMDGDQRAYTVTERQPS